MTDFSLTYLLSHPGVLLILGGVLMAILPYRLRLLTTLVLPLIALIAFLSLPDTLSTQMSLMGYQLHPIYIDGLSWIFTLIFIIAAFIAALYSYHNRDRIEQITLPIYAGSVITAVLAGDLLTLFICWEISALSSAVIVFAGRTPRAKSAGMRYLLVHITSGLLLLLGSLLHYQNEQSLVFSHIGLETGAGMLIFFALAIKCAFPLLHNWLQDAYPEASPTGSVALSVFTTKLAVYCLARAYAGTDALIWVGTIMAIFPVFFVIIENDLRRLLSYSLNNQLGFMVVGIGIGSELSLNGTAAHAFCHILYKSLMFMSMGAVLHQTSTAKASQLGGLYKSMPWTTSFCIIGALSISAFPLFSGFIAKGIILFAVAEEGYWLVWLALLCVSGILDNTGLRVPYSSFFSHDSGHRCREAPTNMLLAMAIAAFSCIFIGVFPGLLYAYLPYSMEFHPYTMDHIIAQLQLVFFALLAFVVLIKNGWYPSVMPARNLDTDWIYRKVCKNILRGLSSLFARSLVAWQRLRFDTMHRVVQLITQTSGPQSAVASGSSVGLMVVWVALLLSACLVFYFIY